MMQQPPLPQRVMLPPRQQVMLRHQQPEQHQHLPRNNPVKSM
jgi:hypothetical protein